MKNILFTISFMLALSLILKAQVSEQEFQALKAFYNATGGDNWTIRTGWENINTTATKNDVTTTWFGIDLIEYGHITEISFHNENNGISGQLPPEIGNLTWLKSISIGNNNITGQLPNEFGNLVNLEGLSFENNKISGPFPISMSKLIKLRTCYLSDNPLNCPFSSVINLSWEKLYIFNAQSCGLTGTVNIDFELFPDLYMFSVGNNKLSGEIDTSINKLKKLYSLRMEGNNFSGSLPSLDSSMVSIREVNFSTNNFSGSIPQSYNTFTAPNAFYLYENKLSGLLPVAFVTKINRFDCSSNYLTFEALEPVAARISVLKPSGFSTGRLFPLKENSLFFNTGEALNLNAATLSVYNPGGNNNRYKWFKNDVEVYSGNSPIYTVASSGATDAGTYHFEVTNTVVAGITLKSDNIAVNIVGANQPPANILLSNSTISENFTGNVGAFTATDPDVGDTHTFALTSGNGTNDKDNGKFSITVNQLKINSESNFEVSPTLNILITANDGNGGIFTKEFVITVTNVNEAPVYNGQVTSNSIDENSPNGTTALTLMAQDPEGTPVVFSITAGNENGAFGIDGNKLIVADNSKLNYDVMKQYNLSVRASDGELSSTAILTITLNKINRMPVVENATFAIDENSPVGTVVGSIVASDPEGEPVTVSFLTGNELSAFTVSGKTISVYNTEALDFEQNPVFNLTINVSDVISNVQASVTINLNNVYENTENFILSFSVPGMAGNPVINNASHTVAVNVGDVSVSSLTATFTLSPNAVSDPASGTLFDFTTPQTIKVTSQSGAIQDWVVTVTKLVGNSVIRDHNLKIYPNPVSGFLHLIGLEGVATIRVYNLTGQQVMSVNSTEEDTQVDINQLNSGNYLLVVESQAKHSVLKFIKQ
jgi:hypothetical protein